jgi:CubicO group peptidase (beta-lactamase class C family)
MFRLSVIAAAALATAAVAQQPPVPSGAPLEESQLAARLAAHLDSLAAAGRFSGVVVLERRGQRLFQGAYGMADREAGQPNRLETRFNLGSINKAFTAAAVRQLAQAGKLSLDDRLIRHLPDYPNREVAERVTIAQLLEHTSGIGGNIFGAPPGGSRGDLVRNSDFIPLFAGEPLQFEPGSRSQYSNAGYVVLGALIERLSGMSYYDYVLANVFQPAGMTSTDSYPRDSLPPNTAVGYTRGEPGSPASGPPRRNTDLLPGRGSAAGGGYSTADDLLRFARAVREGRILGGPPAGIGIGGGAPGINAVLETAIGDGYDLVVLSNLDPPAAEAVGRQVRQWLGLAEGLDGPRIIRRVP